MSQIPIGWLINRGVWNYPFNNRHMIDGILNRPLYFYQKDMISHYERTSIAIHEIWNINGII